MSEERSFKTPWANSTVGRIRWEDVRTETDGENISLIIPAFFRSLHCPAIREVSKKHLKELLSYQSIELEPARYETRTDALGDSQSYYADLGTISIHGIKGREMSYIEDVLSPRIADIKRVLNEALSRAGAREFVLMSTAAKLRDYLIEPSHVTCDEAAVSDA